MQKNFWIILLAAIMLFAACPIHIFAETATPGPEPAVSSGDPVPSEDAPAAEEPEPDSPACIELSAGIASISKYGNIVLTVSPDSMRELGFEPADIVRVRIGTVELKMPIGTGYSDVDSGDLICCFKFSTTSGKEDVILALNAGDLATSAGIAEQRLIDRDPGYEWVFREGFDASVPVLISMYEKQGYAAAYAVHKLGSARSNVRTDYPSLSDAEYANFRAVSTTGMGKDTLFRSSSPVNPALNRSAEADKAAADSLIRTVMNMADSEEIMKAYPDFASSYCAGCDVIALNMPIDTHSEVYHAKIAEGFRFFAQHDGPYLIHCKEGKDRTGFAAAILECLMGASADEVVADYMKTYYNFYGIAPDSEQYNTVAAGNVESFLADTFGIGSIRDEETDLSACAKAYLLRIGLKEDEIAKLKENLGKDYGGIRH